MNGYVLSETQRAYVWVRNAFVKVSGDQFLNAEFLAWIETLSSRTKIVICVGGGTQINEAFRKQGLPIKKHDILGRETSEEGLRLAYEVLKQNKSMLKRQLRMMNVEASIILPVVHMGSEICHIDGDQMVRNAYWGFERLHVVTTPERVGAKREQFLDPLGKIEIMAF